jgi:two-component sensor histidine kinase
VGREDEGGMATAERRYRALLEHMSEGFVVCEAVRAPNGRLVDYWIRDANPIYIRRAPREVAVTGRRQREMRPATPDAWFDACGRAIDGHPVRFEFRDPLNERWYEVHMMRLSDEEFGQLFVDITDRKRAEQRQAELFDELNHRVKNNLTVVSAILALQARSAPGPVREHLESARDRVAAIAGLHTALYQQSSARDVDLCAYLRDLTSRLSAALCDPALVTLETHCDAVTLPVKEAVNVGLIVNELVTNAAKHAFAPAAHGRIRVDLRRRGARVFLTVSDDGRGLPPEAIEASEGLGMRFVRALTQDLGGELAWVGGHGTTARVEFPADRDGAMGAGAA